MLKDIFIGIDPSENSTGLSVLVYEGPMLLEEKFWIIKPDKLTKKESAAEERHSDMFSYVLYEKLPVTGLENTECETNKCTNFIRILSAVKEIIANADAKYQGGNDIYVCQEGISYGSSVRTRSVFDLAGLNFMLREMVLNYRRGTPNSVNLTVATPGEIKKFATGKGNANKDLIIECFRASYPDFDIPKIDDVADAYFMANYAKQKRAA